MRDIWSGQSEGIKSGDLQFIECHVFSGSQWVPLPFYRKDDLAPVKDFREGLTMVPVHEDDPLRIATINEPDEVIVSRVSGEVELLPLAPDLHVRAIELDDPFVHQPSAVRALHLVAREEDRGPRVVPDRLA